MGLKNDWHIDGSWTLFLDRDGVINDRIFGGYVTCISNFIFKDGALEAINGLSQIFNRLIVVTNQQGVAKKIMSESNLHEIHAYMLEQIEAHGGRISLCKVAVNLKGEYGDRRKPLPTMAHESVEEFPEISLDKSIMIGDTDSDILFAKNAGMKSVLVRSEEITKMKADLEVDSLLEFYKLLI